jgi:alkanesulfonate monooxygenase SsuD/methylene tetrahydromethanopterin reductase-like flavin-dependent oxidoreductase (luciferase family)
MPLTFGFTTGVNRDEVAALEALPIDSLWVGGHVSAPNGSPEAMVQLARLSALTERVRIGSAILLLPLYEPAIVAKQIADLDRMAGGRITLGIGVGGEYEEEFRACHVPIAERGKRTDEAIPLIRRLWSAAPRCWATAGCPISIRRAPMRSPWPASRRSPPRRGAT